MSNVTTLRPRLVRLSRFRITWTQDGVERQQTLCARSWLEALLLATKRNPAETVGRIGNVNTVRL